MGTIKDIFKIILVIQLLTCALAFYGHPDAETIDFGSPSQPSRDQLIIEAAIKRGMDGDAVAELLRTKQPVVRTTTSPGGRTKTTTYKLEPDGSISSKSLISQRHSYVYNSDNIPDSIPIDDLRKSPTGTVTRTFTDSDGSKVTQTIGVSKPKASTVLDDDDLSGDWFSKPFPSFPEEKPYSAPSSSSHRTITRTFTGPNGERRTVQTFSSNPEFSDPETSFTAAHQPSTTNFNTRTSTRTYVKPNGERHVIHTTSNNPDPQDFNNKPRFPSIGNFNWPNSYEPSWDTADPEDSEDGWEVVADPEFETTTKKAFAWTPRTWDWPEFTTKPTTTTSTTTTTTTAKPKFHAQPRKPLPNLDDFLRNQYGAGTNAAPATTTVKTETKTPQYLTTTIPTPSSTQHKVINIEDLPVMDILHNGKPADETILRNLPAHLTPGTQKEQVLKINNIKPIEGDIEIFTPQKNIRTFSKTHIGPEKPALQDLDPQMQEVLRKAGISPDDITNIDGDTITKTRTEPDGRVITTTYKVNTVPAKPASNITPVQHHYVPPAPAPSAHTFNSYQPSSSHLAPLAPQLSPISEFLALLGLTKFDITSRNGHYSKTFIDDNGEILTATFVLSAPRGVERHEKPRPKPYK
ncbi:mucin-2-like [Calliphora vicina]|uniref:mucin-2-like n=1 Tax=Calliphora vicina TaxID=7373 RepID=UPI00325B36D7